MSSESENLLAVWTAPPTITDLRDIEALEAIPLEQRIASFDVLRWIDAGLRRNPGRTALTYSPSGDILADAESISFAELAERVTGAAALFASLGVSKQDNIAVLAPIMPGSYVAVLAAMAAGKVFPINWMLNAEAIRHLLVQAAPKVVVALAPTPGFDIWNNVREAMRGLVGMTLLSIAAPRGSSPSEVDLDRLANEVKTSAFEPEPRELHDIVAFIHSGGTTGVPKIVQLESGAIVHKCWTVTMTMDYRSEDVHTSDMPLFHVAGFITGIVLPMILSNSIVIPSMHGARDKAYIEKYWRFVEKMRPRFIHAVPATLTSLSQNPPTDEDVSSLRDYLVTGSTALPVEVAKAFQAKTGIRILSTYGASEFTQNVTQAPRSGDPRYGSAGIRNPDTQIRIVQLDAKGTIVRECETNEIGSILVKSPGTTPGYLGIPIDTSILRGDGWIDNGDLGRLDEDGYLWITGRAKDLIIRSGHNIDPGIIEAALYAHPAVLVAAAVGKPDEYAGELPVAYVQLKQGMQASEQELRDHVKASISDPVAVPRDIVILDEMPLTDVRKVAKAVLRRNMANLTYEQRLKAALPKTVSLSVRVEESPGQGQIAAITLRQVADRTAAEDAVTGIMQRFTIGYRIDFDE